MGGAVMLPARPAAGVALANDLALIPALPAPSN